MPQPNYEMVVVYRSTEKSIQNNTTAPDVDLRTSVQPKHQFTSSDDCQQHDIIRLIPKCEPPKQRITPSEMNYSSLSRVDSRCIVYHVVIIIIIVISVEPAIEN